MRSSEWEGAFEMHERMRASAPFADANGAEIDVGVGGVRSFLLEERLSGEECIDFDALMRFEKDEYEESPELHSYTYNGMTMRSPLWALNPGWGV